MIVITSITSDLLKVDSKIENIDIIDIVDSYNIGTTVLNLINVTIYMDYSNCVNCLKDIERNLLNNLYSRFSTYYGYWVVDVNTYDSRVTTKLNDLYNYLAQKHYFSLFYIKDLYFTITNIIK